MSEANRRRVKAEGEARVAVAERGRIELAMATAVLAHKEERGRLLILVDRLGRPASVDSFSAGIVAPTGSSVPEEQAEVEAPL